MLWPVIFGNTGTTGPGHRFRVASIPGSDRGLFNNGLDASGGPSGQRLTSRLGSVHLEDISGNTHDVLIVGEPGLFKRKLRLLKACHQFGRSFGTPALKEELAREGRHAVIVLRDELTIRI